MSETPRMKSISPFQTRYLRLLRKVKGSKPEKVLERTLSGAEALLEKYSDEQGIREAIGKLWVQSIGAFEKHISTNPKKSANQIRELANSASTFLTEKFGNDVGPLIKEIYKAAIIHYVLLWNNLELKELGQRIAKRIAMDGAENVRKINQEDIAKDILKMPFMKIKPKGGMF
ncbi:MAG: hypothetical protein ACFFDN_34370 [Candidatus Hodarchaeota archaeon]